MLSWFFIRQVVAAQKRLPKPIGPEAITNIPQYPELSAINIYNALSNEPLFRIYFPDRVVAGGDDNLRKVDRDYVYNVCRWAFPGLLTLLMIVANRRLQQAGANAQPQNVNANAGQLALFNGVAVSRRRQSRGAYWMLNAAERNIVRGNRQARGRRTVAGYRQVIRAQFAGS